MSDAVSVERSDLQRIIDDLRAIQSTIQDVLDRPAPPSRGRIEFGGGAVIELPHAHTHDSRGGQTS